MKRVYLVRGAPLGAEHPVVIPAGTGHLEGTSPFRFAAEGEIRASGRASGRHVVVIPVSGVDRPATLLPGLDVEIGDLQDRSWQTAYYARCAELGARITVSAVAFPGGAATARIPAGWVSWTASFVWAADAHGEYPSSPRELSFMNRPAAVLNGAQPSGVVVPPGAKWAAARAPFTLYENYPGPGVPPGLELRSVELADSAAAERWFVVDLQAATDRPRRFRFALDADEAVLCWGE